MNQVQNSVTLIGNLGKDPEQFQGKQGVVTRFSLATTETYNNAKGEKVKTTHWHRCVVFGKRAETLAQYVSKGDKLAVQGKITYDRYQDKNGVDRLSVDIVVSDFVMLSSRTAKQVA